MDETRSLSPQGLNVYSQVMDNPSDMARQQILREVLRLSPFEGWTELTLRQAAKKAGLPKGADALYFPGGILEVLRFWSEQSDQAAASALAELDLPNMRIRDKVTAGVIARLGTLTGHELAAKRALARLAMPDAVGQAPAQGWAAADTIWRAIGDSSTDFNYYSKRTILAGVISSALVVWIGDDNPDKQKVRAFVDDRIENVMQFEKTKFAAKKRLAGFPKPAELLGRLRYGSGPHRRRHSTRFDRYG